MPIASHLHILRSLIPLCIRGGQVKQIIIKVKGHDDGKTISVNKSVCRFSELPLYIFFSLGIWGGKLHVKMKRSADIFLLHTRSAHCCSTYFPAEIGYGAVQNTWGLCDFEGLKKKRWKSTDGLTYNKVRLRVVRL